ncbi:hypothetical protein [uncultured Hymenobacter sp.]|uniref:hypothetical protein n=1 Tax=uncultured Hymenobacter sp. TaxID=170016 RepID=UPI0035CBC0DA
MLRLDKTVTRKVPLHYDQDADDHARWRAMTFAEKREVVEYLHYQAGVLYALSKLPRSPEATEASNEEK